MQQWPIDEMPVQAGYSPDIVQLYCVQDYKWQKFRKSLKGNTTEVKLERLANWYKTSPGTEKFRTEVQVGNYLGALRRGGQLDMQNRVQR